MNIKEYFTDKEIKQLNVLPKTIKFFKRAVIFIIIFSVISSIVNFWLAVRLGRQVGINSFINVLLVWYKNVEVDKIYLPYEIFIAQRVANAHLYLGGAILCYILYLGSNKINNLLLKCWKLLSSEK